MHDRTRELREIRDRYQLRAHDIARITERDNATVRVWLSPRATRVIPGPLLARLKQEVINKSTGIPWTHLDARGVPLTTIANITTVCERHGLNSETPIVELHSALSANGITIDLNTLQAYLAYLWPTAGDQ